ncbi:NAD(FAD)-utilizing dehydrogenase, sll0175 homolog [hydrothermal vent metagenome]|uniref:NAD(FAD)-utilizing dehydrogenase, sll0175 homolog n=1 Tax=hydrothermal vent metagenome TaxID=652676 RepID=A0A3B1DCJ4_9ZZZZ
MPVIRLNNLQMSVEEPEEALQKKIAQQLKLSDTEIKKWHILRKSLDARSRRHLKFVYSISVEVIDPAYQIPVGSNSSGDLSLYEPGLFFDPPVGKVLLENRPVIIGSGPAGMLAGYYLAQKGYQPIILERGEAVKERVSAIRRFDKTGEHDPENNYLFGEGGAGCFSDGKLTCRMTGADVNWVLERFVECGGKPSIIYEHRPHLGSNRLPLICRNFRRKIEALGGEYRFSCRFEGLTVSKGKVQGVQTSSGFIKTSQVILGIGHSARDTYQMLYEMGIPFEQKAFQLGLRIEQPQELVNQHKYGRDSYLDLLGAADYSLVAKGKRDLYSFCMCAGGIIIPSISEPNAICTNGMSNSKHDTPFANSGLMVTLEPSEFGNKHPLAGMELQRNYERAAFELAGRNYASPIQTASDFLAGREPDKNGHYNCSYQRGTKPTNLDAVLPQVILTAIREGLPVMDKKWDGEFLKDAMLVGPEMRGSAPVRILRDRNSWQTPGFAGFYPVGEGAGYAGGIVTAAVDGLRAARKLVENFAPLHKTGY